MTNHAIVPDTRRDELDAVVAAATNAAHPWASTPTATRADALRAAASALDDAADELVALANEESHLAEPRLRSELARTTVQLRAFADVLDEGSWLEAIIDTPDPTAQPPRPDVRRMLLPLGPVVVFGASNFPFAFSVAGGDTASALAAGCPVIVKAHPGHPRLASRTGDILRATLTGNGAPEGTLAVVFGVDAGRDAVTDPRIKAGSFTGSLQAGRALFDLAAAREQPMPFYAEMGSLNPVFVTPAAARARGADIARGFVESFTLGIGQFCTKPGLLFLPAGHNMLDQLVATVREVPPAPMLGPWIHDGYQRVLSQLRSTPAVETLVDGRDTAEASMRPTLLRTTLPEVTSNADTLLQECFGPTSLIVEYDLSNRLNQAAALFDGTLVATVHAEPADTALVRPLLEQLRERAGRIVWNGWPTGVAVTWAMHHGGPYPATTSPLFTSVGTTAMRRFLRPVCYQDMPHELLPDALRDRNNLGIPRRINGKLTHSDVMA